MTYVHVHDVDQRGLKVKEPHAPSTPSLLRIQEIYFYRGQSDIHVAFIQALSLLTFYCSQLNVCDNCS
jgi:hypothetical protein